MRHQRHAENLLRQLGGFLDRLGDLYAPALAAPARMDLCLYHHTRRTRSEQILRRCFRRRHASRHFAARDRDPILLQDFLRLVFMNFHKDY